MPQITETITIVNKSGKVVSTGKQLLSIFKEAKDAYHDKKAEIRAEHRQRQEEKLAMKMLQNQGFIDDEDAHGRARSTTSSRRSHRSSASRSHHRSTREHGLSSRRTALTVDNLERLSEVSGSVAGSRYGTSQAPQTVVQSPPPPAYYEDELRLGVPRRHTDMEIQHRDTTQWGLTRSRSDPELHDNIDMDLAYGYCPPQILEGKDKEEELDGLMTKLDKIMLEAHCVQHTATTIISSLQANPDAMAAVALTLAEISNLVTKMGPGILTAIKGSSPAIFALLISPEFLIAGGVAVGVTIVMFGGFKIIKKIKAAKALEREREVPLEPRQMEEAMVYEEEFDLQSIESWRRGIEFDDSRSQATSVDAELISPEADRIRRSRRKHKKSKSVRAETIVEEEEVAADYADDDQLETATIAAKSVVTTKTSKSRTKSKSKDKEKEKGKKHSALALLLKRKTTDKQKDSSSRRSHSHRPKMIEM